MFWIWGLGFGGYGGSIGDNKDIEGYMTSGV